RFLGVGEGLFAALEGGDVAIEAEYAAVAQGAEIEFDEFARGGRLFVARTAGFEDAARHLGHGAFDVVGRAKLALLGKFADHVEAGYARPQGVGLVTTHLRTEAVRELPAEI